MSVKIENIKPSYMKEHGDILNITINGSDYYEYLDGKNLGQDIGYMGADGAEYALSDHFDEDEILDIHTQLNTWISTYKDEWFVTDVDDNDDVVSIGHRLNVSRGDIEVKLSDSAAERLNVSGGSYEITADGSTSWTDKDFGDQYVENNPGSPTEQQRIKALMFCNPVNGITDIEDSIEFGVIANLREEAEEEASQQLKM